MIYHAFRALRVPQWAKNLLVFFPLLTAHKLEDRTTVWHAAMAFACFSLAASGMYLVNDLINAAADRQHPRKKHRPIAAGALPRAGALSLAAVMVIAALAVSALLPRSVQIVLGVYVSLTLTYSLVFRRIALVDVLVLAALYTLRLFAGSEATAVPLSNWLLAFSMFLFLSLALVKRVAELKAGAEDGSSGRGYRLTDAPLLGRMGLSAGHLSVLVLALYITSSDVQRLYRSPELLWLLCALLFLWVSRIWLKTERGEMHDDPVAFALTDAGSYGIAALAALVMYSAT